MNARYTLLTAVAGELIALGHKDVVVEYPGFLTWEEPAVPNGSWSCGTANETWGGDLTTITPEGEGGESLHAFEVPHSAAWHDARAIARALDQEVRRYHVAAAFVAILREWLTPAQWVEMAMANAAETNPAICHSHDYCDANMAMLEACRRAIPGFDLDLEDDGQLDLMNGAWAIAVPALRDISRHG